MNTSIHNLNKTFNKQIGKPENDNKDPKTPANNSNK